jgi:biotin carboxyl carrier protein
MKSALAAEKEAEVQRIDPVVVAGAVAAVGHPGAIRALRATPGHDDGAWLREGRSAIQNSHRTNTPLIGAGRARGSRTDMKLSIIVEGRPYTVEVDSPENLATAPGRRPAAHPPIPEAVLRPRPPHRLPEDDMCRTPIAGKVIAVLAAPGERVGRNQPVVMIEAMKMEVPIGPAVDGEIKAIHVAPGDAVSAKQVLFELA